jgi:hypothetical protein
MEAPTMSTSYIAYLDPGSASMLVQMIGGGVVAALVALKLFWGRILRFLHLGRKPSEAGPVSDSDAR